MANMNIKSDDAPGAVASGLSEYNSAPTICLNDDQCEALGITGMPKPGTVYQLLVKATVCRVSATAEESDEVAAEGDAPDLDLTLRMDDIEIVKGAKDMAAKLYG